MRSHLTWLTLALFIGVVGCTNPSRSSNQLAQLLATNAPCRVRLEPAWLGRAEHTVRTGFFTNAEPPELSRRSRELQFDWFSFSDKPSHFHFGPKTISRSEGGQGQSAIHTWRASLPSDTELMAASTVSALEKFLGPSQGVTDGWGSDTEMHSTAGWTFFTHRQADEIETVSIFCMTTHRKGEADWRVDSLQVTRGRATPGRR